MSFNQKKDIPKTCQFYTFGCKVNQYETQLIREQFLAQGFNETKQNPDYYIINGCTVTAAADRKCRYLLRSLHKKYPQAKIIVTGCFAKNNPSIAKQLGISSVISQDEKLSFIDFPGLSPKKDENSAVLAGKSKFKNSQQNRLINDFEAHSRAFVKVQDGCDNFCSYCIVPHMRGLPVTKDIEIVKQEVSGLARKGFKEIVLTGINLGMWGCQQGGRSGQLEVLIKQLVSIDALQRLRLSSIELIHVNDLLIEQLVSSEKLCRHLHIPLQSGDNLILKKMNRRYDRDEFLNKIKKIKKQFPDLFFTTDIMVGFPGETEGNFNNTLDFVKNAGFLKVHVFPYSPRPGTLAAAMPNQIDKNVKDIRKKRLTELALETGFRQRENLLNKKVSVLFEEISRDGYWMGYTDNYVQVKTKSKRNLKNLILNVVISDVMAEDTIGIISNK